MANPSPGVIYEFDPKVMALQKFDATAPIYNSLASPDLAVIALSDPTRLDDVVGRQLDSLGVSVAAQMNQSRLSADPPMEALDLEQYIADIIIETSVQGASILEVHLVDPYWNLLRRNPNTGASFLDTDDSGYLWPPIEINFPPDSTSSVWRLCQAKPTTDMTGANLVLTFEDKSVSQLREHSNKTDPSIAQSQTGETRAQFITRVVSTCAKNPLIAGDQDIKLYHLLPNQDFTAADLTASEKPPPASATKSPVKTGHGQPKDTFAQPVGTGGALTDVAKPGTPTKVFLTDAQLLLGASPFNDGQGPF